MLRRLLPLAMLWLLLHHILRAQPHSAPEAAMTAETVTEPPLTRDELLTALRNMNTTAKAISRRGYIGLHSDEYKRRHDSINDLITQLVGE